MLIDLGLAAFWRFEPQPKRCYYYYYYYCYILLLLLLHVRVRTRVFRLGAGCLGYQSKASGSGLGDDGTGSGSRGAQFRQVPSKLGLTSDSTKRFYIRCPWATVCANSIMFLVCSLSVPLTKRRGLTLNLSAQPRSFM